MERPRNVSEERNQETLNDSLSALKKSSQQAFALNVLDFSANFFKESNTGNFSDFENYIDENASNFDKNAFFKTRDAVIKIWHLVKEYEAKRKQLSVRNNALSLAVIAEVFPAFSFLKQKEYSYMALVIILMFATMYFAKKTGTKIDDLKDHSAQEILSIIKK